MRCRTHLAVCLAAALGIVACGRREAAPSVVLYSSIDETYAFRVAEAFKHKTGIAVKLVSDSEAAKSTGLVNRLILERERPVADVFWSGDIVRALTLQRLGLTAPFQPDEADALPAALRDPSGHVHGTAARWRMIIYNKNLVAADAPLPRSMEDLAKPPFASRACLANPLFGTTAIHLAVVFRRWGADRGRGWLQDFARHGGKMVASNGEVKRRVAAGDFAFGLTDSDDVHVALTEGKPVGWIALEPDAGGTCIPAAAVLIRNGPHPEEGRKLAAFLASAEVEKMLAASEAAHFPVRAIAPPPAFGPLPLPRDHDVESWRGVEETLQGLLRGDLQQWVDEQR
jgi:iron(III) transport system substrate-binding protein